MSIGGEGPLLPTLARAAAALSRSGLAKDGAPVLAYGTMGGEGQPQTQAAMLTHLSTSASTCSRPSRPAPGHWPHPGRGVKQLGAGITHSR